MSTTVIKGDAQWQPCLTKAAMLILDIYNYHDPELPSELVTAKSQIWDHWVTGWEQDLPSGMFCKMYYPKMAGDLTPLDVCPPALVFRGSEMNEADIDELAVSIELNCNVSATGMPGWMIDDTAFSPPIPTISPSGRFPPSASRDDLRTAGLQEEPLILPSTGREVISTGLIGTGINLGNITVDWTGSASLFYGMNGDWPTNVAQSLGRLPPQYREACEAAREAASEAMRDWNGRLMILGHSLGGGLASAAALAANKAERDLAIKCNTFNASGLHPLTARRFAQQPITAASGAGITAHSLSGDVLTSVQTPGLIPLLRDIFRWANVTLPQAIPAQSPSQGISPGGPPSMMFSSLERAPKWANLPRLFPLENQQLVTGDFATLGKVFDAASSAANFEGFVGNLLDMLFRELGDSQGRLRSWHLHDFYQAMGSIGDEFSKAGAAMVPAITSKPPIASFPTVNLGTSRYMRNQVNPFVNGMIRDSIEMAQIMYAAVDYHMWDGCAYTFQLERQ